MSIVGRLTGRDSSGEYSGYVKEIRDRKAAELAENSRINKLKRYFWKNNLENGVEEIASFEEPEIESSEPKPTIKSCIKTGIACTKEGILNKGKKIREYWESIGDAPVMQPTYIAIEPEAVHDEETREKVHETLSNSSKQKIPVTSNYLSEKKARKSRLKILQGAVYNTAHAERKASNDIKAERKAIERGHYYGSTTVSERPVDRAKTLGRDGKKIAAVIQDVTNELGQIRIRYETRQSVKQVKRKINNQLRYPNSTVKAKSVTSSFAPTRRSAGPRNRKQTLNVHKASPTASSAESSPASSRKGGPASSNGKDTPVNSYRKESPAGFKVNFSPASCRSKHGSLVNKTGFTGFRKQNKERPSFL